MLLQIGEAMKRPLVSPLQNFRLIRMALILGALTFSRGALMASEMERNSADGLNEGSRALVKVQVLEPEADANSSPLRKAT
ncbi:MAG: hypothetical protein C5B49_05275 [Bdellovibrio sp.]|nr:MAG: hypothetical protein C5B49_05275 [Bdellovibrio sp.]